MCAISYISMLFGLTNRLSQNKHRIYSKKLQKSLKIAISRSNWEIKKKQKESFLGIAAIPHTKILQQKL